MPPHKGLEKFKEWLSIRVLGPQMKKAVQGALNPTALLLTQNDVRNFAADYAPIFREHHPNEAEMEPDQLLHDIFAHLAKWQRINVTKPEDLKTIPLHKLVYLGDQFSPEEIDPDEHQLILTNFPEIYINGERCNTNTIVDMDAINEEACNTLREAIGNRILESGFKSWNDPLWSMKEGFMNRVFFNANGDGVDPNRLVLPDIVDEYDMMEYDPCQLLMTQFGTNWQKISTDYTGVEFPLPATKRQLNYHSKRVYITHRNGVSYKIREWDPASVINDMHKTGMGTLYPRVACLAPKDIRPQQLHGIAVNFSGPFRMQSRSEIEWPGWESEVRRHGQFITQVKPGIDRR